MEQPQLPWELIERIIEHSADYPNTLSNFALTCRQLRPLTRCMRFGQIQCRDKFHVFAFLDLLQADPGLKSLVRSIVVNGDVLSSFPLLHTLPGLSEIVFQQRGGSDSPPSIYQSSLAYFRRFGTHIQSLRLSGVSFATNLHFARLLLAFPNVVYLSCTNVNIEAAEDQDYLYSMRRRMAKQMRLKSLTIDFSSLGLPEGDWDVSAGGFLLDSDLTPSTVESLRLTEVDPEYMPLLDGPTWSQLRRLVLHFHTQAYPLGPFTSSAVKMLESFDAPMLRKVVVEVDQVLHILDIFKDLGRSGESGSHKLERTMLKFSEPRLVWNLRGPLRAGRNSFWTREVEKRFPALSQRGAIALHSTTAISAGHDDRVSALAASPDSKWVATASGDSTIILWDMDGKVAQQWTAHGYTFVRSLTFSPDSRRLVSGGEDGNVAVWDRGQGTPKGVILEGHTAAVSSCAWRPNGCVIASGSEDGSMRLWDAHTLQHLDVVSQHSEKVMHVAFSPDGHHLVSVSSSGRYNVRCIVSGIVHPPIHGRPANVEVKASALSAFDPGGMRLATLSWHAAAEIWHVRTREETQLVGGYKRAMNTCHVSFSPDGRLLSTVSEPGTTVKIWDSHSGVELHSLKGHTGVVHDICFSPCGKYIATASWDRTVRLWRASDGSQVKTFCEHQHSVDHVAFSPDGKTLWSAVQDGTVVVRPTGMDDFISREEDAPPAAPHVRFPLHTVTPSLILHRVIRPLLSSLLNLREYCTVPCI